MSTAAPRRNLEIIASIELLLKEIIVAAYLCSPWDIEEASGTELWDIVVEGIGPSDGSETPHLPQLLQASPIMRFIDILRCFNALKGTTLTEEEVCAAI